MWRRHPGHGLCRRVQLMAPPARAPLNGSKVHPLSEHAKGILRRLAAGEGIPVQEINAGAWARLLADPGGALATSEQRPSPYKVSKGRNIPFAAITAAGRKAIS